MCFNNWLFYSASFSFQPSPSRHHQFKWTTCHEYPLNILTFEEPQRKLQGPTFILRGPYLSPHRCSARVQFKDQGYLLKGVIGLRYLWKSCSRHHLASSHSMLQCQAPQSLLMLLLMALFFHFSSWQFIFPATGSCHRTREYLQPSVLCAHAFLQTTGSWDMHSHWKER